jgi:hypothetical protein
MSRVYNVKGYNYEEYDIMGVAEIVHHQLPGLISGGCGYTS